VSNPSVYIPIVVAAITGAISLLGLAINAWLTGRRERANCRREIFYEVLSWHGWYRHITLALLAQASLPVLRAAAVGTLPTTQKNRRGKRTARRRRGLDSPDGPRGAAPALAAGVGVPAGTGPGLPVVPVAAPPSSRGPTVAVPAMLRS
jgi:hypothetical protein